MIQEIYMKNCALIDELRLTIDENLNILTGETGAGKSIIIDAINLCLGNKYDRTFLRKGTDKGVVEIVFYTENENVKSFSAENGIDLEDDGLMIVTRSFTSDGKSSTRINGRVVKLSTLKAVTGMLVDVHGQHQNNALLNADKHIEFLDLFGGEEIEKHKIEYKKVFSKFQQIKRQLNEINENKDDREIEREIDLLKFQIDEIEAANLDENEYIELLKQREIYRNSEKIYEKLNFCYEGLNHGDINAVDIIGRVSKDLSDISKYDESLGKISEEVDRMMYELQDISADIRNYKDNIDFEPYELEQIEIRVDDINNLRRKYGNTIEEILKYHGEISDRLSEILNRDERVEALKKELSRQGLELAKRAKELTETRVEKSVELEKLLLDELESLNMKNVTFKVEISDSEFSESGKDKVKFVFSSGGKDKIEFMVSFNLGEDMKPINKVASGGEMSRFMLAFKTILADIDGTDTLIFDEIDTGISGIAAQIVGTKLRNISDKKQVICITHLPQIAANATTHFLIEKSVKGDRTFTSIDKLDEDSRVEEIARLIAGSSITKKTLEHAKEIINETQNR
ncbi:MAG: DNA repair protein RecN [Clostridioides sp.]|nr:DNA repair protein RecN [Clostridioides sp.]